MEHKPVAAGKSSFDLIDREKALAMIDAGSGSDFLDLACGVGKYSLEIAITVGATGTVYAVDLWQEGLEALEQEIRARGIKNIKTVLADISAKLPLADNSIDSCLLATILHDLSTSEQAATIQEAARVLRSDGMLNIIEFKKIDKGPGPPKNIRMAEDDIKAIVSQYGFKKVAGSDIGEFNYLLKYRKNA